MLKDTWKVGMGWCDTVDGLQTCCGEKRKMAGQGQRMLVGEGK